MEARAARWKESGMSWWLLAIFSWLAVINTLSLVLAIHQWRNGW